jgi:hypothetical protein
VLVWVLIPELAAAELWGLGAAVVPAAEDIALALAAGDEAAAAEVSAGGAAAELDAASEGCKTESTEGTWTPALLHAYVAYAYESEASFALQDVLMQLIALEMYAELVQRQTTSEAAQLVTLTAETIH